MIDSPWEKDMVETPRQKDTEDVADQWRKLPDTRDRSSIDAGQPRVDRFELTNHPWISSDRVEQHLRDVIPPDHLRDLQGIRYSDEYVTGTDHHGQKGTVLGTYNTETREVTINRQHEEGVCGTPDLQEFYRTIDHEVGHLVYKQRLEADLSGRWDEISRASRTEPERFEYVSEVATEDPDQDFAESYRVYVENSEDLRSVDEAKYQFMKDHVFRGRTYESAASR